MLICEIGSRVPDRSIFQSQCYLRIYSSIPVQPRARHLKAHAFDAAPTPRVYERKIKGRDKKPDYRSMIQYRNHKNKKEVKIKHSLKNLLTFRLRPNLQLKLEPATRRCGGRRRSGSTGHWWVCHGGLGEIRYMQFWFWNMVAWG
jgi:hypothetical protein